MTAESKSIPARLLSLVVPVKDDELARLAAASLSIFLLMTSYYIMKAVRSSKFLDEFGSYYLLFTYYGNAFLTLCAVTLYNRLVERFDRSRLIDMVYATVALVFLVLWLVNLGGALPRLVTLLNYFFVCVYILVLTALLWSLIHDTFMPDEGKRLYGLILLAAQGGVFAGSRLTSVLAMRLGTMNLIPVSLLVLGLAYMAVRRLNGFRKRTTSAAPARPGGSLADLKELFADPYARLIFFLVVCSTFGVTMVDWQVNRLLDTSGIGVNEKTVFYGTWGGRLALLNILFLLVSGRVVSRMGPEGGLVFMPLAAAAASIAAMAGAGLNLLAFFWILCQSMNYTLYNTGKENLYVPTDRMFKYKYKAINDGAGYRFGDATAASSILLYVNLVSSTWTAGIGAATLVLGVFWIPAVFLAGRKYRKAARAVEDVE